MAPPPEVARKTSKFIVKGSYNPNPSSGMEGWSVLNVPRPRHHTVPSSAPDEPPQPPCGEQRAFWRDGTPPYGIECT